MEKDIQKAAYLNPSYGLNVAIELALLTRKWMENTFVTPKEALWALDLIESREFKRASHLLENVCKPHGFAFKWGHIDILNDICDMAKAIADPARFIVLFDKFQRTYMDTFDVGVAGYGFMASAYTQAIQKVA